MVLYFCSSALWCFGVTPLNFLQASRNPRFFLSLHLVYYFCYQKWESEISFFYETETENCLNFWCNFMAWVAPGGEKEAHMPPPVGKAAFVGKIFQFRQGVLMDTIKYVIPSDDQLPQWCTWFSLKAKMRAGSLIKTRNFQIYSNRK